MTWDQVSIYLGLCEVVLEIEDSPPVGDHQAGVHRQEDWREEEEEHLSIEEGWLRKLGFRLGIMRLITANPWEELDVLGHNLAPVSNQALQVGDYQEKDLDPVSIWGHLDQDELVESEAEVVEDRVEPPVHVGGVAHSWRVTGIHIKQKSDSFANKPVRIEDESDEESDVHGRHQHPHRVALQDRSKEGSARDSKSGFHIIWRDLDDGECVEREIGDGEDEGGRQEQLCEVVEEPPEISDIIYNR